MTILSGRAWQPRRVVLTKDAMHFAFRKMDLEVDNIPLSEIMNISETTEKNADCGSDVFSSLVFGCTEGETQSFQISTQIGGHNSGRTYYLRIRSNTNELFSDIKRLSKIARKRAEARTLLQRAQLRVRKFYESDPVQAVSKILIGFVSYSPYRICKYTF